MSWEYLPRFSACRDIGHQWDYFEWYEGKRTLVCANCDAKRKDVIDGHGKITSRSYTYPNGYETKRVPHLVWSIRKHLEKEARKLERWVGSKHNLTVIHKKRA